MTSLKEYTKDNDIINEIRLSLKSPSGKNKVWILVEGIDDIKIYSKFFITDKVKFKEVPGACEKIGPIVDILIKETRQVIGIKDADFLRLNKTMATSKNIFITDYHDIEMMIISCDDPLRNLYYEYPSKENAIEIREKILNVASFLGYTRWFNDLNHIQILFSGLALGPFYDENCNFKKEEYIQELNKRSAEKKQEITIDEISSFIKEKDPTDLYQLCNGHDVCILFALHISKNISKKINNKDFEKYLRISYRKEDFLSTHLYSEIKNWSDTENFKILSS